MTGSSGSIKDVCCALDRWCSMTHTHTHTRTHAHGEMPKSGSKQAGGTRAAVLWSVEHDADGSVGAGQSPESSRSVALGCTPSIDSG